MQQKLKSSFKSALLKILKRVKGYRKYSLVPIGEISSADVLTESVLLSSNSIAPEKKILPITIDDKTDPTFNFSAFPFTNFVIKAKNWSIWGNQGAVITAKNHLLHEVSREYDDAEHSIFKQFKLKPSSTIDEMVAVLAASGAEVYYHWMMDILPRINLLKEIDLIEDIDKFVINYTDLSFQQETLKRAGIAIEKILPSTDHWNFHITAETLIIPSLPSPVNRPSLESALYLRTLFGKEINNDLHEKYIYIQRKKGRTITNENELLSYLLPLGFEVLNLEELSVAEQATLFSKAKIIIGPHGSGFTNIIFCKPNTIVIDLFSPNWINPCFWILSNHLQLKYAYLIGTNNNNKTGEINKGANMHISIKKLEALLKKVWIN